MLVSFTSSIRTSDDVLFNELNGESVLLNLSNESYYGLDEIGTIFWQRLVETDTIEDAHSALLAEYDVEPEQLRQDLSALVANLVEHGLISLHE